MKTKRNAIAISVYDKFEEVELLVDIIRENWEHEYIITICCNHPDGRNKLEHLPIDSYVQGDPVPYFPGKPRINLRYRVIDTIRKSCKAALELNPNTIMHVHSDAWPLNEKKYLKIVSNMYKNESYLALRGFGHGVYPGSSPLGHVDDMFFIVDAQHAKHVDLFNIRPLALLPHLQSIHGILNTVFLAKVGLDKIYHYDNHMNMVLWKGKKKIQPYSRGKPVIYDENYEFLHLHRQSFPDHYGEKLQAIYLRSAGLIKGKYIKEFINKWQCNPNDVYKNLDKIEFELDRKIKWIGYRPEEFGQEYVAKIDFLKNVKIKHIINNLIIRIIGPIVIKISKLLNIPAHKYTHVFTDSKILPMTIKEFYLTQIDEKDFIDASDDFWFNK
jgi:hypothetical protein